MPLAPIKIAAHLLKLNNHQGLRPFITILTINEFFLLNTKDYRSIRELKA